MGAWLQLLDAKSVDLMVGRRGTWRPLSGPSLSLRTFGRSALLKGPLDLLIRPKADRAFTVRRTGSRAIGLPS
ncbi:hypothetical protein, partial [Mesorhizobium sp. M7A.F.Ca.CA.001.10.2.1]|uniref:hypothetical protein n=1 Tax=Mesorhizobium sp. M7A.F.Ca.CA.001.10.2.1 TaxID=2496720 RepID=UPI0019D2B3B7